MTGTVVGELDNLLKAGGLIIEGVSLGSSKSKWRIDWIHTPTKEELQTAQTIINNFDVAATEALLEKTRSTSDNIIADVYKFLLEKKIIPSSEIPLETIKALKLEDIILASQDVTTDSSVGLVQP